MQHSEATVVRQQIRWLDRYKPFVIAVLGLVLVAAFLPGEVERETVSGPVAGQSEAAGGPTGVDDTSGGPGEADAAGTGAAADAAEGVEQAVASDPEQATAGQQATASEGETGPAPAMQWAQADPMEAPDCDQSTGRLMVPSSGVVWAPNCVPMWPEDADNFGATYQGVTEDTITIAYYMAEEDEAQSAMVAAAGVEGTEEEERHEGRDNVIEAYQSHFETYGREVEWVEVEASGGVNDDEAARSDAIRVAEEIGAFASITSPATSGGGFAYVEELEARGVLCIECAQNIPHWEFDDGYMWNIFVSGTGQRLHVAGMLGNSVGGGPAEFAGDPAMQLEDRRFGLIQYNTEDNMYDYSPAYYEEQLNAHGLSLVESVDYLLDVPRLQEQARTMITRLKDAGVTTIICACDPISPAVITQEATNQQYFPEWVLAGGYLLDTALFARTYDELQWENAFGIGPIPARMDPEAEEEFGDIVTWHHGEELDTTPSQTSTGLLFTGIHLAGPELTPETFGNGLRSLQPAHGYKTRSGVSYGPGVWEWDEYNATDDVSLIWWDPNEPGPDELDAYGRGMYRYVNQGQRYLPGETPPDVAWFDPENTSTVHEERPESDRLPQYERREPLREP